MQISNLLRTAIILIVIALNSYAIAQNIIYESLPGVFLAVGSMGALAYCIHLMKKLKEVEASEDEQLFH